MNEMRVNDRSMNEMRINETRVNELPMNEMRANESPMNETPMNKVRVNERRGNRRVWRVRSITTGVTLLLMGIILAASLWTQIEAYEALSWIGPVIFILLGIEVLLYLKYADAEKTGVRYDWFSIFTVGIISTLSIVLALFISTGLYDEMQRGMQMMQRSVYVSHEPVRVPEHVEKIIVHSLSNVEHYESDTRELQLLGQLQYWSAEPLAPENVNLLETNTVGSTMYVMIGTIDRRDTGWFPSRVHSQLSLFIPEGIEVIHR